MAQYLGAWSLNAEPPDLGVARLNAEVWTLEAALRPLLLPPSLTILDCSATVCITEKTTCAVAVTERATSTVAVNEKSI